MIKLAKINQHSAVLDLGCGPGIATRHIAQYTGAKCVGLDLTPANIARATELAASQGLAQSCEYMEGSFTSYPAALSARKFTHIWSQVALCHVHKEFPTILEQAKGVLAEGGKAAAPRRARVHGQLSLARCCSSGPERLLQLTES